MNFRDIYDRLSRRFSAVSTEGWWPHDTDFEIMIGAVLTQNTNWRNVDRALANLRAGISLDPRAILSAPDDELRTAIRPAGSFVRKSQTLRAVSAWYLENAPRAEHVSTAELRAGLLGIHGVGPETADDILLYVFDRPVFIFDTYARRMLAALGLPTGRDYESTRLLNEAALAEAKFSVAELAAFHALVVTAGKVAGRDGWADIFAG